MGRVHDADRHTYVREHMRYARATRGGPMTNGTVKALKAHVALDVSNVERSTEFYRKLFGIEPSKVRRGYAKFDVSNPPLNFSLNERPVSERGALSHMGIQVGSTEDVLAMRERWIAQGLVTRDEMKTDCCYALQDKTWVRDPDGNEWEVFVVLEDNLAEEKPVATSIFPGLGMKPGPVPCCAPTCCAPTEAVAG
jgi:catechol 2,3-dioxygenase-like lactoylglutathione lyase family enzyme